MLCTMELSLLKDQRHIRFVVDVLGIDIQLVPAHLTSLDLYIILGSITCHAMLLEWKIKSQSVQLLSTWLLLKFITQDTNYTIKLP